MVLHEAIDYHCPMCGTSNGEVLSKENQNRICGECEELRLKGI